MTKRFSRQQAIRALIALVGLQAGAATAQDVCLSPTNSAPGEGAEGAPRWLPAAQDSHGGPTVKWLNDIRWADAARAHFADQNGDASYRVIRDGDYLLVSIQSGPLGNDRAINTQSRIYFGIGNADNGTGGAVAINLLNATTNPSDALRNAPTLVSLAQTFQSSTSLPNVCSLNSMPCPTAGCGTNGICGPWRQTSGERAAPPAWVTAPAVWVNESPIKACFNDTNPTAGANTNGRRCNDPEDDGTPIPANTCGTMGGTCLTINPVSSIWGVNFKIKISGDNSLGLPLDRKLQTFLGVRKVSSPALNMREYKRYPDVHASSNPDMVNFLFDATGTTTNQYFEAMIPRDMRTWVDTTVPAAPCEGAKLDQSKIGRQAMDGNYDMVEMLVRGDTGNKMIATVECPGNDCGLNTLDAQFRVANWGSNFDERAWMPLGHLPTGATVTQPTVRIDDNLHFTLNCQPNVMGLSTCGLLLPDLAPPRISNGTTSYHQCTAVEIMPAPTSATRVGSASEYVNTRFEMASTIQSVATIDVKGLAARLGNNLSRSVYLFVSRRNMPGPTSAAKLLPRNEMMAGRLEALDMYSCSSSNEDVSCVGMDGPVGLCAYPCNTNGFCQEGDLRFAVDDTCYCSEGGETSADVCYSGQPDGRDQRNAPDDVARLTRAWPTYMVNTVFDTGKTYRTGNVTYKIVQGGTEFGMYVDHVGVHHGFTDSLVGLNNLAVTRVSPDVYLISVPNEGKARMQVTVTATEDHTPVPLTVISGVSTDFGIFGSVEIVGLSAATTPLDLRRASVRVDRLMSENGRELVRNLAAPRTLLPLPGALPTVATFANTTGVDVVMEVIELPILGRLTTTIATGTAVDRPTACPFAVGAANLTTSFSINDTVNPLYITQATQPWACIPFIGMLAL